MPGESGYSGTACALSTNLRKANRPHPRPLSQKEMGYSVLTPPNAPPRCGTVSRPCHAADRRSPLPRMWHGRETVPQHAETVPQHAETVPQHAETVPQHAETVPQHAETVPQHAETVPQHAETVPQHAGFYVTRRMLRDQAHIVQDDGLAGDAGHELLENPQVQGRGGIALGMELGAEGEPVVHGALDGLDDAVGASGGDGKARRHVVDRHVVHAVDADFPLAVDPLHERAHLDLQGVAVVGVHRVEMRDRPRQVFGNVQEEGAALRDVQEAACRSRRPSPASAVRPTRLHQPAVEVFAARRPTAASTDGACSRRARQSRSAPPIKNNPSRQIRAPAACRPRRPAAE